MQVDGDRGTRVVVAVLGAAALALCTLLVARYFVEDERVPGHLSFEVVDGDSVDADQCLLRFIWQPADSIVLTEGFTGLGVRYYSSATDDKVIDTGLTLRFGPPDESAEKPQQILLLCSDDGSTVERPVTITEVAVSYSSGLILHERDIVVQP